MEVVYLYHSSFAVRLNSRFLIFDYYLDTPHGGRLSDGVINPAEISGDDVTVFASHHHPDHFSPRIFAWRSEIPQFRCVLANDIRTHEEALFIRPGQTLETDGMTIHALKSTDAGVAFLIHVDGVCIYHAGDLNWWKWNEDTEQENAVMERKFKAQIETLRGEKIDLAFLPVDPRQGDDAVLGLDWFMHTVGAKDVIPMHSFDQTDFFSRLKTDPRTVPYRDTIHLYSHRGEVISL